MISKVLDNQVELTTLVEHPGGHDGGTFTQPHTFGMRTDGDLFYEVAYPDCPNDTFCEADVTDYALCSDKAGAVLVLQQELVEAQKAVVVLTKLLEAFAGPGEFVVSTPDDDE